MSPRCLDRTFNTVELVGKPLSIGHFVNRQALGTPVFTSVTNIYSPYIAVGDFAKPVSTDELIRGTDYQEVITNFPLGSTILTGLFLKIDVSGPDGPTETFERTLTDVIGFDVRTNGGSPNITFNPNGPPTLTPLDVFSINISPGRMDLNATGILQQRPDGGAAESDRTGKSRWDSSARGSGEVAGTDSLAQRASTLQTSSWLRTSRLSNWRLLP